MNRVDRAPGVTLVTDHPAHFAPAPPPPPDEVDEIEARWRDGYEIVALRGRITAGLGVQLLWAPLDSSTYITVALNGETETFPVPPEKANEAFDHPYAYGASLPL